MREDAPAAALAALEANKPPGRRHAGEGSKRSLHSDSVQLRTADPCQSEHLLHVIISYTAPSTWTRLQEEEAWTKLAATQGEYLVRTYADSMSDAHLKALMPDQYSEGLEAVTRRVLDAHRQERQAVDSNSGSGGPEMDNSPSPTPFRGGVPTKNVQDVYSTLPYTPAGCYAAPRGAAVELFQLSGTPWQQPHSQLPTARQLASAFASHVVARVNPLFAEAPDAAELSQGISTPSGSMSPRAREAHDINPHCNRDLRSRVGPEGSAAPYLSGAAHKLGTARHAAGPSDLAETAPTSAMVDRPGYEGGKVLKAMAAATSATAAAAAARVPAVPVATPVPAPPAAVSGDSIQPLQCLEQLLHDNNGSISQVRTLHAKATEGRESLSKYLYQLKLIPRPLQKGETAQSLMRVVSPETLLAWLRVLHHRTLAGTRTSKKKLCDLIAEVVIA